jgi:predicted benzoate:H+ symporter BenE
MFGETSEKVVMRSLKALAAGRSMIVSGWKNKLMTSFVSVVPKPLMSRMAGIALAHFRMKQVKR